ncbi:MAG: class I SAM-dependent methyltransferase, partial [Chloroflexota bacterium]
PGGRVILFCPNRWFPFETHGHYWRGKYHFGNTPLINYLPRRFRDRLAPHVRAYSKHDLERLVSELDVGIVFHSRIFPGFDNIVARWRGIGQLVRKTSYWLEKTPLRLFGLSHLLVLQKD